MNFGADFNVLQQACDWLDEGKQPLLFTVIETWGSSPRPVGSHMLLEPSSGQIAGSVSGGCVEDELVYRARTGDLPEGVIFQITFGEQREEAARLQLPCGSILHLLAERLTDRESLEQILTAIKNHYCIERKLTLSDGFSLLNQVDKYTEDVQLTAQTFTKSYGPKWTLLIIGATDTARYLTDFAPALGYRVLICEPRSEYRDSWNLPEVPILKGMPDDVVSAKVTHSRFAILALTHDAKLDDMALLTALESPAFYVGAIGSKKTCESRRERLALLDIPAAAIDRLHGPVGLPVGSKSPPEIAISILADLVRIRAVNKRNKSG